MKNRRQGDKIDKSMSGFILYTGGIFANNLIRRIDLPKFELRKTATPGQQTMERRSSLLLTFYDNPSIYKQLFVASKKGFEEFKLQFFNKGKVISEWNFKGTQISSVDFGFITKNDNDGEEGEEEKIIQCEIDYMSIDVDGIIL